MWQRVGQQRQHGGQISSGGHEGELGGLRQRLIATGQRVIAVPGEQPGRCDVTVHRNKLDIEPVATAIIKNSNNIIMVQ